MAVFSFFFLTAHIYIKSTSKQTSAAVNKNRFYISATGLCHSVHRVSEYQSTARLFEAKGSELQVLVPLIFFLLSDIALSFVCACW